MRRGDAGRDRLMTYNYCFHHTADGKRYPFWPMKDKFRVVSLLTVNPIEILVVVVVVCRRNSPKG